MKSLFNRNKSRHKAKWSYTTNFTNHNIEIGERYIKFLDMLEYKLRDQGKCFIRVGKYYPSSQLCHQCGRIHPEMKDLHIRIMDCTCGCKVDRDYNAALNNNEEEGEVLHGIDLTMKEGSFTALVGPSGGGKSTVAKLIARFWDVTGGKNGDHHCSPAGNH